MPALLAVLASDLGCAREDPPNVLVVVIDTLRADRLGAYGNERGLTPFLDTLAARGTLFVNAYATSSWTCPSIASLMTARYPTQHHVINFTAKLGADEVTFAQRLRPLRYVSGGFSANFRLLESLGYARGFEQWRADTANAGIGGVAGDELHRQSLEWLDRAWHRSWGLPALLYLQYMEPHGPYDAPEPFRSRFGKIGDGVEFADAVIKLPIGTRPLTPDEMRFFAFRYDAEVAAVDEQIRLLFSELDQRGFLEHAIIVITADHGEEFGEHGGMAHGRTLYNESVRVPLIVVAPGYGGNRVDEDVSLVDVGPTLLALLGLPPEPRFEGRSLVPLLEHSWRARLRRLLTWEPAPEPASDIMLELVQHEKADQRVHQEGLVRQAAKVLVRPDGTRETYDVAADPGEQHADPGTPRANVAMLSARLEAARRALASRAGVAVSGPALDEATKEQLRALGYQP